jgi:hypothetical protein
MIYNAMFDEVDEGTAMFKLAPVTLDADGCRLPNDWYLNLAGQVSAAIASGRSIAASVPMAK